MRLFWLGEHNPRRVPGAFRFPFGPVRYMDAGVMLSLYREIFLDRGYEVAGLGDAPVILDCGGNIGMSVIWFKQRYPRARITVFEADPQIADLLEENVRALGLTSVTVVRAAVSDATGKVSFVPEGSLGGHVGDKQRPDVAPRPGVLVNAVRLSDLITEPVDYLKVDIEGSEFGVLKDLCATGKMRMVKYVACELHGNPAVQDQVAELWTALSRAGFRITVRDATVCEDLPGPPMPTPFLSAPSAKYLVWLYAWRV
jgi:FkbM family methyltransferase